MSKLHATKTPSKKETRKIIYEKLSSALGEYRGELKEKKVARNLKKFSKVLADDIARSARKRNGNTKPSKNKALAKAEHLETAIATN